MRYDLASLARRQRNVRRSSITLRDIVPPATLATDLYRACYWPVIDLWQSAIPRIMATYERSLSELITDTAEDVTVEIEEVQSILQRLTLTLTVELRDWALKVEKWQRGRFRGAVLSATGVDLGTMIGPEDMRETLATHIEWNTSLIKDVSDQARRRIGNTVYDGLRNRAPARDVAKGIRDAVEMGRRRSIGIASDQLSKLTSALADERRREAGISFWTWMHSRKLHPRANHVGRNGNIYSDDAAGVGTSVDGKTVLAAPQDRPGQLPWCGCRSRSVISFD